MDQKNHLMTAEENQAMDSSFLQLASEYQNGNNSVPDGEVKLENFTDSDIERLLESPNENMLLNDPLSIENDSNSEVTTAHVDLIVTELQTMDSFFNGHAFAAVGIKEETASYNTTGGNIVHVVKTEETETNSLTQVSGPLTAKEAKPKKRSRKKRTDPANDSQYIHDADAVRNIVRIAKAMKQQEKKENLCKMESENPEEIGQNKKKRVPTCSKNIIKTKSPKKNRIAEPNLAPSTSKQTDSKKSLDTPAPISSEICSRCLWPFNKGETIWIPPCGQLFHNRCVYLWAKKLEECPVCHITVKKKEMTSRKNRVQRKP